jgi:hypothetical protein
VGLKEGMAVIVEGTHVDYKGLTLVLADVRVTKAKPKPKEEPRK